MYTSHTVCTSNCGHFVFSSIWLSLLQDLNFSLKSPQSTECTLPLTDFHCIRAQYHLFFLYFLYKTIMLELTCDGQLYSSEIISLWTFLHSRHLTLCFCLPVSSSDLSELQPQMCGYHSDPTGSSFNISYDFLILFYFYNSCRSKSKSQFTVWLQRRKLTQVGISNSINTLYSLGLVNSWNFWGEKMFRSLQKYSHAVRECSTSPRQIKTKSSWSLKYHLVNLFVYKVVCVHEQVCTGSLMLQDIQHDKIILYKYMENLSSSVW